MEGIEPECAVCPVPPVTPEGQRILELWGLLNLLHDLVDGGTILRMYGATREEVELLALVAGEIKSVTRNS